MTITACCQSSLKHVSTIWRRFDSCPRVLPRWCSHIVIHPTLLCKNRMCSLSYQPDAVNDGVGRAASQYSADNILASDRILSANQFVNSSDAKDKEPELNTGRVMLIDGTSIIYRAYYKLLAKLHHGHLTNADGNGEWVLTIFTALSLIIDVLEFIPSHVVVVFDHDGNSFSQSSYSPRQSVAAKGLNFRHTLYPDYKSNRTPTPDTIVQGLQYLKASIKAMNIRVIEVPGVEADDVIGTLAVRRLRRGLKCEFVDVLALICDRSDNIPGVEGIGNVHAVRLITKFGSLDTLLERIDEVAEERIKNALISNANMAILSKNLALLHSDLPYITWFHLQLVIFRFEDQKTMGTSLPTC